MTWTWRLETVSGLPLTSPVSQTAPVHQTQSDAETWIGETWRTLVEEGAATASLFRDGEFVYGPMGLTE
jgi:hypothetical protein